MDDIKRALQQIYAAQQQVDEAPPAATANLSQGADLKGTFNAPAFAKLLGMDASEATQLASFVNKHKRGTLPARTEIMAAADVFRALIDAAPQTVNQAMTMLRKITAESMVATNEVDDVSEKTLYGTPDEYKRQLEIIAKKEKALPPGISAARKELAIKKQEIQKKHNATMGFKEEVNQVEENLRLTKEGLDECWTDMNTNGMPAGNETMTVSISMPNKNISVTTDSADELMNVLKLAGIEVNDKQPNSNSWTPPTESAETNTTEPSVESMTETELEEVLKKSDPAGKWIKDFIDSDNPKFAGKSKKERMQMALGAYYAAQRESIEQVKEEDIDENAYLQAAAAAARDGKDEFEFPAGSGKMHPVKMEKDTAHQMGESENVESQRILQLAGLDESKLANSPAGTSMDEPKEYDSLPSEKGTGAGKPDYGTRQSNMGGENPMAVHTMDLEESFQNAMNEYREFVAEKLKSKK